MSMIFRKFYKKKPDIEYWIPIRDVNITYDFQLSSPRIIKFKRKEKEFLKNGTLGKIILNHNYDLVDGYCIYLICKKWIFRCNSASFPEI